MQMQSNLPNTIYTLIIEDLSINTYSFNILFP